MANKVTPSPVNIDRLSGWREIAAALEVSVRTAQRWREGEGMPVDHHQHNQRSTPIASRIALRQWRDKRSHALPAAAEIAGIASATTDSAGGAPAAGASLPAPAEFCMSFGRRVALILGGAGAGIAALVMVALAAHFGARYGDSRRLPKGEAVTLQAPQHVYGVLKAEGRNQFTLIDLVTGEAKEWRFCPRSPDYRVPFFAGFVLTKLTATMLADCEFINNGMGETTYIIARGKQRADSQRDPYNYLYRDVTYDETRFPNWADRPVLARNCASSPDDTTTLCTGGEAEFSMGAVRTNSQK